MARNLSECKLLTSQAGGSSAGHNGIDSIDKFIGKDYSRVRIGIGNPSVKKNMTEHVYKFNFFLFWILSIFFKKK